MLPTADQYIQTLENDPVGAPRLREYRLERDNNGALLPYSGNSVLVLPATLAGRKFALRFFHNIDRLCFQRYEAVCEYLRPRDLPWKVDSQYLDKTIRIGEQYYPVLRMDWTEGWLLHEYIGQIVHDRKRLSRLQENLVALSQSLEKNGIGHGDLNFHHVLLVPDSQDVSIRLLDYDALFIPEFSGQTSISAGSPGFQHPGRLSSHYSETVDRFSIWIMIAALEAFKIDPKLWTNAPEYGYRNH